MKLYDYIPEPLLQERIAEGYVNINFHKTFTNLAIYTHSKSATLDYVWDEATCKCRGLIVDTATMEIIARPFEKFFNVGESEGITREQFPDPFPQITDKLDGNLITLYPWDGRWWAASKGSFHSEHADWANNWLFHRCKGDWPGDWPVGYTPVFEMIAEELEHHVVHYGKEVSGLYLIALIDNETGAELNDVSRAQWANNNDIPYIPLQVMSLDKALTDNDKNEEGYVLAWPRPGQTPVRVKVKFTDFLRLQKLVHHIGPKEILDYMTQPHLQCYLDEALNPETSHPVFIEYTKKWMQRFDAAYHSIFTTASIEMDDICLVLGPNGTRKEYAQMIVDRTYPSIMFAMLDGNAEKVKSCIWKQVEPVAEQEDDIRNLITQEE